MTIGTRRIGAAMVLPWHLAAGALALGYAWLISGTALVASALQFVAPLAVIIVTHLAIVQWQRATAPGYAIVVLRRSLVTAFLIMAATLAAALLAPMPSAAASATDTVFNVIQGVLTLLFCLFMISVIVGLPLLLIFGLVYLATKLFRRSGKDKLNDGAVITLVLLAIAGASVEGVTPALTVDPHDSAAASVEVSAPPPAVWEAVGTATAPEFPLPAILKAIPQPVAVIVDEGASLGARRVVRFSGREGTGDLVLQVVRRDQREARFAVIADTSPIANWVKHRALSFEVEPVGSSGARLTVRLDYDRLLSPSWFFRPLVRLAASLAVDVLARDTARRAETG